MGNESMKVWNAAALFVLVLGSILGAVFGQAQTISLSVSPSGLVSPGTKLDLQSCWNGFPPDQAANAFLIEYRIEYINADGGSWIGLPAAVADVSGTCARSTFVIPVDWAGLTIGLRAVFQPTGLTSNVEGLSVSRYPLTLFVIEATVLDQTGKNYDGVSMELWQQSNRIDSGSTKGGKWSSIPVEGGGRPYKLHLYNGNAYVEPLRVYSSNVQVTYELIRSSPSPILIVSNVSTTPSVVHVGNSYEANLVVTNKGSMSALTSALTLNLTYPFAMVGSGTTRYIGTLGVDQNVTVNANIAVDASAKTGTYSIVYILSYTDNNNYTYVSGGTFGVTIYGTPQVEIQSISIDPASLSPGANGFLALTLSNTGTERATAALIKIFNGDDILTSTTSYVGELEPGKSATVTLGIQVQDQATLGLRSINVIIDYGDPNGAQYNVSRLYDTYVYPPQSFIPTIDIVFLVLIVLVVVFGYIGFKRLGFKLW